MRCFEPSLLAPFSLRFRPVDDVDSLLLVVVRRVRLAPDDSDENLAVRGMLSIDDCDEAALEEGFSGIKTKTQLATAGRDSLRCGVGW